MLIFHSINFDMYDFIKINIQFRLIPIKRPDEERYEPQNANNRTFDCIRLWHKWFFKVDQTVHCARVPVHRHVRASTTFKMPKSDSAQSACVIAFMRPLWNWPLIYVKSYKEMYNMVLSLKCKKQRSCALISKLKFRL